MRLSRYLTPLATSLLLVATPLLAEPVPAGPAPAAAFRPVFSARLSQPAATTIPSLAEANQPNAMVVSRLGKGGRKEAVALMLVGAAGIVTGLLVNEDIVTIAGAGVAGLGLFFYLR